MTGERQYLDLLQELLDHGDVRMDRTGVGTLAKFGHELRFDLSDGFPLLTTKRVFWKKAFGEILWMLSGGSNIRELLEQDIHIWTDWPLKRYQEQTGDALSKADFEARILADEEFARAWGGMRGAYGEQWRRWRTYDGGEIDQVQNVIELLKNDPTSRRIIWEGWNVALLDDMVLPPCHKTYQFYVKKETSQLCCAIIQRSGDLAAGVPWNIASGALVTTILAQQVGLIPGEFIWYGLDVHLYLNHVDQAREQLSRAPRSLPHLRIHRKPESLFEYTIDDFEIVGYDPHPYIPLPIAV